MTLAAVTPVSTYGGGFGFPVLPAIVVLPVIAAVLVVIVPRENARLARAIAIAGGLATFGLTLAMLVRFRTGQPGYQFVTSHTWISSFGISWSLGVDGISVLLLPAAAILFPAAMVGAPVREDEKTYLVSLLVLETACLGSFVALDMFLFFVFFELTLPPMYFLIGRWGGPRRAYAALKFFVYTFVGSALMLIALLSDVFINARSIGHVTFSLIANTDHQHVSADIGIVLFLGFAAAFAVKIPMFPLHTWLPDAQQEAGTGGSMILAGAMFILGTYGLVRFCIELFPRASVDMAPLMLTLGVIGIVYGFCVAVVQTDLKRMIAYTLVADLGVIVVGLFGFTTQGISGGVYQMVNHGVSMGAMFLLIGLVIDRFGTGRLASMGGLQARTPVLAAVFLVVTLSAVGVPGLNGFIGEFLLLLGTFLTHRWWAVVAATGVILSALVFLWAYQQVFHGPLPASLAGPDEGEPGVDGTPGGPSEAEGAEGAVATARRTGTALLAVRDLGVRDLVVMAPLLVVIVLLGVYPRPFLERINPSADRLVAHVSQVTGSVAPPAATGGGNP